MSGTLVLEYSPRARSRWRSAAIRLAKVVFIIMLAAALGRGFAFYVEPRVFRSTGLIAAGISVGEPPLLGHEIASKSWQARISSAAFRAQLDEQIKHLPGIRVGAEHIQAIPDSRLLFISEEGTDSASAAKAAHLAGETRLQSMR